MLRLDPAHPPLWRTPTALQFGAEAVAVVDDPSPWQERFVRELERGIPDGAALPFAVALGATRPAAEQFLDRIGPALEPAPPRPAPAVLVQAAGDLPPGHLDDVITALTMAGCEVAHAHPFDPPGGAAADAPPVVVVAAHLVPPGFAAALMADDRAHLPVVFTGTGAEIGPYIVPGQTACLSCLAAHRRDSDPAWPAVAAQLLGRALSVTDPSIVWEAGIAAARMISESGRRASPASSRSLTLRAGSLRRSVRQHRPHEECRCRSLAGTATAAALVNLAPTTPTAFALPA